MSHFAAEVIQLPPLEPHPNANSLSLVRLEQPYKVTVVCRTEDWKNKEKAVYVPVDAIAGDAPEFSFLGDKKRIKAVKLRGILSMGLLVPCRDGWEVGQDVTKELGVVKYDDSLDNPKISKDLQAGRSPRGEVKYTDIESLRKYTNVLLDGEDVVCSEKIHGENSRFVFQDNQLFVGSRTRWLKEGNNSWWNTAFSVGLPEILPKFPDKIFFGEIYGYVQDMRYGHDKNEYSLRVFDVYDIAESRYLNFGETQNIVKNTGLELVPILYKGPWEGYDKMTRFANGESMVHYNTELRQAGKMIGKSSDNFKEGFVVKPTKERYDDKLGRVILKYHSEEFLTRK